MLIRIDQVEIIVKYHMIPPDEISLVSSNNEATSASQDQLQHSGIIHILLPLIAVPLIRRLWPLKIRLLKSWLMLTLTVYSYIPVNVFDEEQHIPLSLTATGND